MSTTRDHARAPRIGLLVDLFEYTYQSTLIQAVMDTARRHGASVRVFVGGGLRSPERFGAERNFLYDLVGGANIDGLIVLSSTLANYVDHTALVDFAAGFRPLPMASIGMLLEGIPSVAVDNAPALREGIRHLVRVHGHRRIAFVRGPAGNQDAEERYRVYREVLAEHEIPLDAALIAPGDFQAAHRHRRRPRAHRRAARVVPGASSRPTTTWRSARSRPLRAPAGRAKGRARRRGRRWASTISTRRAIAHTPLASVRQPLREQGELAAEMVLAQLRGDGDPGAHAAARAARRAALVQGAAVACRHEGARSLDRGVRDGLDARARARGGLDLPVAQARGTPRGRRALRRRARRRARRRDRRPAAASSARASRRSSRAPTSAHRGSETWHDVIKGMRDLLRPALAGDAARALGAEDAWHEAHVLIAQATERALARRSLAVTRWARTLSAEASDALSAARDVPALMAALVEQLPRLQIPSAQIVLFESRRPESGARLALSVRNGIVAPRNDTLYPAARSSCRKARSPPSTARTLSSCPSSHATPPSASPSSSSAPASRRSTRCSATASARRSRH